MRVEIKVPAMGESITEAIVGTILKPSGTAVAADDEVLELETDKVNQVLYAPQAGVITITVAPEDRVKIGQVIGYVETEAKAVAKEPAPPRQPEPQRQAPAPQRESEPQPQPERQQQPSARFTRDAYVEELTEPKSKAEPSPQQPQAKPTSAVTGQEVSKGMERRETRRKMSRIRKVIATRLVEVQQTTAMLTTFNEVDLSAVMQLREKYKDVFLKKYGAKLGFMSFFVKAVVASLKEIPDLNSYIADDDIVRREYYDIGIAVGTEKGLIVPVVRNCDQLTFPQIEGAIENFAKKAREGGLSVDDLQGGGFTITNGGVYGSLLSTPILNAPQSGILGMHKISKRAIVVNDEIVIRPMMYLALSYDHRIVDGKEAVTFLVHVKNLLEDPSRLLLEV